MEKWISYSVVQYSSSSHCFIVCSVNTVCTSERWIWFCLYSFYKQQFAYKELLTWTMCFHWKLFLVLYSKIWSHSHWITQNTHSTGCRLEVEKKNLLYELSFYLHKDNKNYKVCLINCISISLTFSWATISHDVPPLQAQTSMVPLILAPLCFVSTSRALTPAQTACPSLFSWRMDGPQLGRSSPLRSWGTPAHLCRRSSASSPSGLGMMWITGCWSAWLWKTVGWWDASTRKLTPVLCSKGEDVISALWSL